MQSAIWTLAIFAVIFLTSAHEVMAATVTAMWDAEPDPTVTGYLLSYGTQSHIYTTRVDVGNVTSHALTLAGGQRYYFVVQAYNASGQTSPMSIEVVADVFDSTPPAISTLSPTTGTVGTAVTISGTSFGATPMSSSVRFNGTLATP